MGTYSLEVFVWYNGKRGSWSPSSAYTRFVVVNTSMALLAGAEEGILKTWPIVARGGVGRLLKWAQCGH